MQRLLILLIYTVFQRYILSFTAEPLEGWKKKSCDFSTESNFSQFPFTLGNLLQAVSLLECEKEGTFTKRKRKKKEKLGRISSTLNNNGSINYPPLGPVCASPTGLTTVTPAPAPVWEDSLIFRTPYWLGLAQRFWLAASLRPVLTRGFWFG